MHWQEEKCRDTIMRWEIHLDPTRRQEEQERNTELLHNDNHYVQILDS